MEIIGEYTVAAIMAVCACCGYIIKHSITALPNKYIPLTLGLLGVALNIWAAGGQFTPEVLLGGLASGLAATGAFEIVKNLSGGAK